MNEQRGHGERQEEEKLASPPVSSHFFLLDPVSSRCVLLAILHALTNIYKGTASSLSALCFKLKTDIQAFFQVNCQKESGPEKATNFTIVVGIKMAS